MSRRHAEFEKRRTEREEQINQIIQARKLERETLRKKIYYVRSEEERLRKLHEEEEARKHEGMVLSFNNLFYFLDIQENYFTFFVNFELVVSWCSSFSLNCCKSEMCRG